MFDNFIQQLVSWTAIASSARFSGPYNGVGTRFSASVAPHHTLVHGKIGRQDTGICLCAAQKYAPTPAREQAHALFAHLMQLAQVAAETKLQAAAQVIRPEEMGHQEYPIANDAHRTQ